MAGDDNGEESGEESTERNDRGLFVPNHDVNKESVLEGMDSGEPYTTAELSDQFGIPRRTMFDYLDTLNQEGEVRKKKPEPRRAIWIREDNGGG